MSRSGYRSISPASSAQSDDFPAPQTASSNRLMTVATGSHHSSILDYQASLKVFALHVIGVDAALYVLLTIVTTSFLHYLPGDNYVGNLSWTFVSFAVVFPITWNIGTAYRRRDTALVALSAFKAHVLSLLAAHRDWSWAPFTPESQGRHRLPHDHTAQVRKVLIDLTSHVEQFLLLPCVNRSRHIHTSAGSAERNTVRAQSKAHLAEIHLGIARLSIANERMKVAGMPANEASRVNQYVMYMFEKFNELRFIKGYRTPEGIRSFARVFVFIHPLFYGPYYAYVASISSLGFAIAFSILIGMSMIGLLNVEIALEDPFDKTGSDRIRVAKLFEELRVDLEREVVGTKAVLYEGHDLMTLTFSSDTLALVT